LGIEPVVEVNNDEDLKKAFVTSTKIIAVNARNLETFAIDVDGACELLKKIPKKFITLGFSGVHSVKEVMQYKDAGAKGVLVGTSLMKAKNIEKFIMDLRVTEEEGLPIARMSIMRRARREGASGRTRNAMTTKVKICGVRDIKSAEAAIEAGADFLGFNFVKSSTRSIDPTDAKRIIDAIKGKIKTVGVFQETSVEQVNKIAEDLDLDYIQLHGNEDVAYRKKINGKIIQKIHTDSSFTDREGSKYFLLDREIQGKGKIIDLSVAEQLAKVFHVFIAGGLTPENVGDVVKKVKPFAVDVAGGIETKGQPDARKIKQFIRNAKEASL